jgi:two-component system, LytTR family, response regulator
VSRNAHSELSVSAPKPAVPALRAARVEYVMKRNSAVRLTTAIEKVREKRKSAFSATIRHNSAAATQGVMSTHSTRRRSPTRLMGENSQRLYFIPIDDVDYIEADGNYVLIHVGDQKYVRRDTLKRLASALRDEEFEYIRRSTLINLARVVFAEKLRHGALAFTLSSGARLVSRTGIRRGLMNGRCLAGDACE